MVPQRMLSEAGVGPSESSIDGPVTNRGEQLKVAKLGENSFDKLLRAPGLLADGRHHGPSAELKAEQSSRMQDPASHGACCLLHLGFDGDLDLVGCLNPSA
ncbi:MAG: hypothetical protein M3256_20005 [Actinomycetota bacterium]|nr:hypothetical protein [Actinomycetota bacterium]